MLTPEQVALLRLALEDRKLVQKTLMKAAGRAKAEPHSTEHTFINDGGLLSFAALFFTRLATNNRKPQMKKRKELLHFLDQLSDEACGKCARQLEMILKHEKTVERFKRSLQQRMPGLFILDSSGSLEEAKGLEGDSGFYNTYTTLPLQTTQTLVSPAQHDGISSSEGDSQQDDDISSSEGDSQPQNDDISQSSEMGNAQPQDDDISQSSSEGDSQQDDDMSSSEGDSQPRNDDIPQSSEIGGSQSSHPQSSCGSYAPSYAPIPACNSMFPTDLAGAIQRRTVATVQMTPSESPVFLRINITPTRVQSVARELFGVHLEDERGSRCIYTEHAAIFPASQLALKRCDIQVIPEFFGKYLANAIYSNPQYQRERREGQDFTTCVSMLVSLSVHGCAQIVVSLDPEQGRMIQKRLYSLPTS